MEINKGEIRKFLIINLGGIGDLLLSTGALKPLREKYKSSQLDLLIVSRGVELMRSYGFFENIYVYPESIFRLIGLLFKLRKNKYDLVMNMRTMVNWLSVMKIFFIFKIINGKISAGRNTEDRGFFLDIKIPETYLAEKLEYEYDLDLVKALKVEIKDVDIYVPYDNSDIEHADKLLEKYKISEEEFTVGINPGGLQSRRWPEENFVEVIKMLLKYINCKIILIGSNSEKNICQNIFNKVNSKNLYDFSGLTTIRQLAVLMTKFKILVSNDTSTIHIGVCMNTPGVFIFGPGQTTRYAPYKNKDKYMVLYKPSECSPCEKKYCINKKCLNIITVEEVYNTITELKNKIYA